MTLPLIFVCGKKIYDLNHGGDAPTSDILANPPADVNQYIEQFADQFGDGQLYFRVYLLAGSLAQVENINIGYASSPTALQGDGILFRCTKPFPQPVRSAHQKPWEDTFHPPVSARVFLHCPAGFVIAWLCGDNIPGYLHRVGRHTIAARPWSTVCLADIRHPELYSVRSRNDPPSGDIRADLPCRGYQYSLDFYSNRFRTTSHVF